MPSNKRKQNKKRGQGRKMTDLPLHIAHTFNTLSCKLPVPTSLVHMRTVTTPQVITASASLNVAVSFNFSLNQTSLGAGFFDRYKIDAIRATISPQQNAVGLAATQGSTQLYCVIDYDDFAVLPNLATAISCNNVVKLSAGESCSRTFKPRIATAVFNGAFAGYANTPAVWIDSASTNVQHYGFKIIVAPTNVVGQTVFQSWEVSFEYYISMMNTI